VVAVEDFSSNRAAILRRYLEISAGARPFFPINPPGTTGRLRAHRRTNTPCFASHQLLRRRAVQRGGGAMVPVHHRITNPLKGVPHDRHELDRCTSPDLTGKRSLSPVPQAAGKATADALAHAGAHVVLAVRNPAKGRARSERHRERHRGP